MIKIFTILGLILQFVAFWFAAPEILGVDWLKKAERIIREAINKIPSLISLILGIVIGLLLYFTKSSIFWVLLITIIVAIQWKNTKRIEAYLDRKISQPIMNKLIISQNFRYLLLKFAAIFFTVGFIIQLIIVVIS